MNSQLLLESKILHELIFFYIKYYIITFIVVRTFICQIIFSLLVIINYKYNNLLYITLFLQLLKNYYIIFIIDD